MKTFDEKVAAFLISEGAVNPREIKVTPYGTEWAGDTMSGFHDEFSVSVSYQDDSGAHSPTYSGEGMQRLWLAVVAD